MKSFSAATARNSRVSLDAGHRLDEHRALDGRRFEQRPQVVRPETPTDRIELVAHPRVRAATRVPEVVMGVDDHYGVGTSSGAIRRI